MEPTVITIENEFIQAAIRTRGAELASLVKTSTGREYIWQADPDIWGGSAPILFPIIGKLKDGQTFIDGKSYSIPKHGVLRTRDAVLIHQDDDTVEFQFCTDDETYAVYPYEFSFTAEFQLLENGLSVNYTVQNTGDEIMLFSVGSHPAFKLDLNNHSLEDYTVEFSEPETLDLYGFVDEYLGKVESDYLINQSSIQLKESIFEENALIFRNIKSRTIRLNPAGIEIDIRNHPHLGIWQMPGAPYICIEPWFSYDDAIDTDGILENKPGIMKLFPNETFETGYSIYIR
jgi:galactose mutarotase-like enzyme